MLNNPFARARRLKKAIRRVISDNDQLLKDLAEYEKDEVQTNLTWAEEELGVWKGWTYSPKDNRYYFDDIGHESIMGLWEDKFLGQAYEGI
jgi:hypothetical protein